MIFIHTFGWEMRRKERIRESKIGPIEMQIKGEQMMRTIFKYHKLRLREYMDVQYVPS